MYIPHHEIEKLVFRALDLEVENIATFSFNDKHIIYDIKTKEKNIVLRISDKSDLKALKGSVYCLNLLAEKGLPVPKVLYVNDTLEKYKYYFTVIERIEGIDLGFVYPNLNVADKRKLAEDIVALQNKVANVLRLESKKTGKMFSCENDLYFNDWYSYVSDISNVAENLEDKSLFDIGKIYQFEEIVYIYKPILNSVEVKPYLAGVTARNVIMKNKELNGIVDIDYISFGDNTMQIALTKMMLLRAGYDLYYTDFWSYEANLDDNQYMLLDLYMLRYCLQFMSDIGYKYKQNNKLDYNKEIFRLNTLFSKLYTKLKNQAIEKGLTN